MKINVYQHCRTINTYNFMKEAIFVGGEIIKAR